MPCPKCGSSKLRLRDATGFESLLLLFISKRQYRCVACSHVFRAQDRRRVAREDPSFDAQAERSRAV